METVKGAVRFGAFEVDLRTEELRKHGLTLRLPRQSFQILTLLLRCPGDLVSRGELREKLWPADTFVDFDHGLNAAVNRLREALGDSTEKPRFIETLPRRGYRFIFPVDGALAPPNYADSEAGVAATTHSGIESSKAPSISQPLGPLVQVRHRSQWIAPALSILLIALLAASSFLAVRHRRTVISAGAIHSIAVLPLENLSDDPQQEYFADGMTDELITNLAKLGTVRVISRTSIMQFKRAHRSAAEIGRKLNVDAVVEGTVARSGNNVRITAQLIHASSDRHLWADEFQGELRNMLALQSQVARTIADQIHVKLTEQQVRVTNSKTISPQAYEYYLRGRYNFSERWSREGYDNAIRYFEMAIESDPNYAPPYAGLANCYALGFFQGMELPPREAWSKAAVLAKKALELDDQLAEAHIAIANVRFRYDWNWPEAEREFKRGLELSPNDVLGHTSYAIFLAVMGRPDEAMAEVTRARELDPLSPHVSNTMSWIYNWSRQPDEAITESRRTLQLDPNFSAAHSSLVWSYEEKGMYAEAVSEELKMYALTGHSPEQIESLRNAFAASGITGFWEKSLEWDKRQLNMPHYLAIARLCVRLDRKDEAFQWLEKAYQARQPNMPNIKIAAVWLDPIRSDPRYADLMRRVGLTP